jgi:hypothetical protein
LYEKLRTGEIDEKSAYNFAYEITPLLRSISEFSQKVSTLSDTLINLLNRTEAYMRLDFITYISFGLDEYNRKPEEKRRIRDLVSKIKDDDFGDYIDNQKKELLDKLN